MWLLLNKCVRSDAFRSGTIVSVLSDLFIIGKTSMFLLLTVDRLLRHSPETQATRAIVLSPTREQATQIFTSLQQLVQFTSLTALLMVDGVTSPKDEEEKLLKRPDVIIATPDRLVDHLENCKEFTLDGVEVFVLDEADMLVDEGFKPQIEAVIEKLPKERQSMMATTTMDSAVNKLAKLALRDPVTSKDSDRVGMCEILTQEYVHVDESTRMPSLIALCSESCTEKTVIFFDEKKTCARVFKTFEADAEDACRRVARGKSLFLRTASRIRQLSGAARCSI